MVEPQIPDRLINVLTSHTAPINAITFSSLGGTYILTGSSDRQVHLSRTEPANQERASAPIQKYVAHGYPVLDITVSRDNQLFASVGGDRSVFLWDVQNADGTLRRLGSNTNQAHTSRITCIAFAGEADSVLASGSDDRTVRLWDVKSRDAKPLMIWEEAKDGVSCLCVPDNGHEVISGSIDGRVRSYDLRMGRIVQDVMPGPVTSLETTRDGKVMLVGCLDGKIRLIDRTNGVCLRAFPENDKLAGYQNKELRLKSCFGASEAVIMSGSEEDGKVRAWNVITGGVVSNVSVHANEKVVSVVRWREASKALNKQALWAAGGAEGVVKIYAHG